MLSVTSLFSTEEANLMLRNLRDIRSDGAHIALGRSFSGHESIALENAGETIVRFRKYGKKEPHWKLVIGATTLQVPSELRLRTFWSHKNVAKVMSPQEIECQLSFINSWKHKQAIKWDKIRLALGEIKQAKFRAERLRKDRIMTADALANKGKSFKQKINELIDNPPLHRPLGRRPEQLFARIKAKVNKNGPNGCWLWMGSQNQGAGQVKIRGVSRSPRLVVYQFVTFKEFDPRRYLRLECTCGNSKCINPSHMLDRNGTNPLHPSQDQGARP